MLDEKLNSLIETHPDLVREWDHNKNTIGPEEVSKDCQLSVWWECSRCKYSWTAPIKNRAKGTKCPKCALRKVNDENNLDVMFPEISKEWDFYKNGTKKPHHFKYNSDEKVWWRCSKCEHSWAAKISQRTIRLKTGCPACANLAPNKYNNLKVLFEEVAADWYYIKNYPKLPTETSPTSKCKVWWKCKECGYSWLQSVKVRTVDKAHCPECKKRLWAPGGDLWNQINKDKLKLNETHPELLLDWDFSKNELSPEEFVSGSAQKVFWKCHVCSYGWESKVNNRAICGNGCPKCSKNTSVVSLEKSFGYNNEHLLNEWDYSKNSIDPYEILPTYRKKVCWICSSCGSSWETSPFYRAFNKSGCLYCSGKLVNETNCLTSKLPELVLDWDYDKNIGIIPDEFSYGATIRVWWKCHECGYNWRQTIAGRSNGGGKNARLVRVG